MEIKVLDDKIEIPAYYQEMGEKYQQEAERIIFSEVKRAWIQRQTDEGYNLYVELVENPTYSMIRTPGISGFF